MSECRVSQETAPLEQTLGAGIRALLEGSGSSNGNVSGLLVKMVWVQAPEVLVVVTVEPLSLLQGHRIMGDPAL